MRSLTSRHPCHRPAGLRLLVLLALTGLPQSLNAEDSNATTKTDTASNQSRLVPILSHQLRIDQWPVYGSTDSKLVVVKMFDYTCSHCRSTHQAIVSAKRNGLDLAIVALPVPLHQSCNVHAKNNEPSRSKACDIAKHAVAVWLVDRSKFNEYHDWLFQVERNAGEARTKAIQLVGQQALDAQLAKGTPAKYISKHVTLYKQAGAGTLPKLVFPRTTVVGEVSSATTITNLVKSNLSGQ